MDGWAEAARFAPRRGSLLNHGAALCGEEQQRGIIKVRLCA